LPEEEAAAEAEEEAAAEEAAAAVQALLPALEEEAAALHPSLSAGSIRIQPRCCRKTKPVKQSLTTSFSCCTFLLFFIIQHNTGASETLCAQCKHPPLYPSSLVLQIFYNIRPQSQDSSRKIA
jgi:hypothetical protein